MNVKFNQLPGPKKLPLIGNLHQVTLSDLHTDFENWATEFGEVYRVDLGPQKFTVISKPELIQKILKARPTEFRRMAKMDKILRSEGVHGVFNAENDDWKIHRNIVAKGLDVKHQKQFFPFMVSTINRLFLKMEKAALSNEVYAIQDDLTRFTVDVTTSLAFGFEMNTLEQKGGVIQEHMEKIFPMLFKRINDPIPFYKIYRTKKDKEYDFAIKEIENQVDLFIEAGKERIANNKNLRDNPENFLEAIIVAAEEENSFSNQEIKGNLLTLLLAGEDTTSHSLAWGIYLLCQNPEVQIKLQAEADAVLENSIFLEDYSKNVELTYTEAVINEILRLKSVAPLLLLEPNETTELEGYEFKKGAKLVLITRFGATKDAYFSDSNFFQPERWLKESAGKCPVHNVDAFMPFGSGPRFCPGKNLAILEMKLVLSMIFKNFDVEMITDLKDVKEVMAFTMMPSKFEVKLKRRNKN